MPQQAHCQTTFPGQRKMPCSTVHETKGRNAVQIQPYLFFEGRCEEALMFYRDVLAAGITQPSLPEAPSIHFNVHQRGG